VVSGTRVMRVIRVMRVMRVIKVIRVIRVIRAVTRARHVRGLKYCAAVILLHLFQLKPNERDYAASRGTLLEYSIGVFKGEAYDISERARGEGWEK